MQVHSCPDEAGWTRLRNNQREWRFIVFPTYAVLSRRYEVKKQFGRDESMRDHLNLLRPVLLSSLPPSWFLCKFAYKGTHFKKWLVAQLSSDGLLADIFRGFHQPKGKCRDIYAQHRYHLITTLIINQQLWLTWQSDKVALGYGSGQELVTPPQ